MASHSANDYSRYSSRYENPKRHASRRGFIIGGVAVGCVAAAAVATPAMASSVIDDLKERAGSLTAVYQEVVDAYKSGDFVAGQQAAYQAATEVSAFEEELQGPLWSAAQIVPVYGTDVKAARQLVSMLSNLTSEVLVPVSDVLVNVNAGSLVWKNPDDSIQINVEVVQQLSDILTASIPTINDAISTIADLPELHISQLKSAVESAQELVEPLQGKLEKVASLLALVPDLLGADGQQRNYVIVAQSNVEIRSTGGFAGAWIPVYVSNGCVYMGDVCSVDEYMTSNTYLRATVTDEEYILFGDGVSWIPGNVGADPDFSRVAEIWAELAYLHRGEVLSGILAVDPVFFQNVVGLTDGGAMSDGTWIDGTNAARLVLHDAYWNYMGQSALQDAFFADAAGVAMDVVMDSLQDIDMTALVEVIKDAIDEWHLFAWLADPEGEALLEDIGCSGSLSHDETKPVLGVYMYNVSWSKIEWWLDCDVQVGEETKNTDGSRSYPVEITLTNVMTWDELAAADGDGYLLGANAKLSDDDIVDEIFLYPPAGGLITDATVSDNVLCFRDATHDGFQVKTGQAHIQIDNPVTIQFTVTTSTAATEPLTVRKTPTLEEIR